MALSKEEIAEAKRQLKEQIKNLPPDKQREALEQIEPLTEQAIETMLEQQRSKEKVYRLIVQKEIQATIVEENTDILAVLEIMPASKGHTLIIPKQEVHETSKIPTKIMETAKRIAEKIKSNLNAKDIIIQPIKKFSEVIIELIPIYETQPLPPQERQRVEKEELEKTVKEINTEIIKLKKPEPEKIKIEKNTQEKPLKLPRRIP